MNVFLPTAPTILPATNYATPDAGEHAFRVVYTTGQSASWQFMMPINYSGNPTLDLIYKMQAASGGNIVWGAEVWAVSSGDTENVNNQSFDTQNLFTGVVPPVSGYLGSARLALTYNDNMTGRDFVQFRVSRNSGTAVGEASLLGLTLNYDTR